MMLRIARNGSGGNRHCVRRCLFSASPVTAASQQVSRNVQMVADPAQELAASTAEVDDINRARA